MEIDVRQGNAMSIRRSSHIDCLLGAHIRRRDNVSMLIDDVLIGLVKRLQHRLNALVALGECRGTAIEHYRLSTGQSCDQVLGELGRDADLVG